MVDAFQIIQDRISRSRLAGDPPDLSIYPRVRDIGLAVQVRILRDASQQIGARIYRIRTIESNATDSSSLTRQTRVP